MIPMDRLVLAVVRLTVEAIEDHSLVVERFSVPADLAAQGVSGEALADSLVNRVAAIRPHWPCVARWRALGLRRARRREDRTYAQTR